MTDTPQAAIDAAMEALSTHRWKTMGPASAECECGAVISGQSIAIGPSFDPDGPGYETAQFPADEAFRRHLAEAALEAAASHIAAAAVKAEHDRLHAFVRTLDDDGTPPESVAALYDQAVTAGAAAERQRMQVPDLADELKTRLREAMVAQAVAAERQRIAQLIRAEAGKARASSFSVADPISAGALEDFADLLEAL